MNELSKQQQQVAQAPPKTTADPDAPASAQQERPQTRTSIPMRNAAIATGAVGVALLGTGIGLLVAAKQAGDEITNPPPMTRYDPDLAGRGRAFDAAGISMLVIGGVAAVAAISIGVASTRRPVERRRASVGIRLASNLEMTF